MKIVTLSKDKLKDYLVDPEMLRKAKRPCVLIVKLKYKGSNYCFAVPIRSNINASTPKNEYFPLPPRPSTRPKNRHGIHYAKMFPVNKQECYYYRTEGNAAATLMKQIIDRNATKIIKECQEYLNAYEKGIRPKFATDIDLLLSVVKKKRS